VFIVQTDGFVSLLQEEHGIDAWVVIKQMGTQAKEAALRHCAELNRKEHDLYEIFSQRNV
jgi:hypothetical protein